MFGQKKNADKTVLVLDIESGSVAGALVLVSPKNQPRIVSYHRIPLQLSPLRSAHTLTKALEQGIEQLLVHMAEVCARMRIHAGASQMGAVSETAVFLAAPWGVPNLLKAKPEYLPGIREFIQQQIQTTMGGFPVVFYTSADALAYGSNITHKHNDTLLASLRGELLELLLFTDGAAAAYSTVPVGSRSIVRTLRTHGALHEHEANSIIALLEHNQNHAYEPLISAGEHLSKSFAQGAELMLNAGTANNIVVVADHPLGEWFAKSIAEEPLLSNFFTENTTVEALRPHHVANHLQLGAVHDPFILVDALFVGNH